MAAHRMVFYLDSEPVGIFRSRSYPTRAGRVRYEPFRGTGHVHMKEFLLRGKAASCWFQRRGQRMNFDIVAEIFTLGPKTCVWEVDILRLRAAANSR